jgi:hypothetical protein
MASFQSSTKSIRNPDAGEDTRPINRPACKLAIVRQLPSTGPSVDRLTATPHHSGPEAAILVRCWSPPAAAVQIKLSYADIKLTFGLKPFIPQKPTSRQSQPLTAGQPLGYMANVGNAGTCAK